MTRMISRGAGAAILAGLMTLAPTVASAATSTQETRAFLGTTVEKTSASAKRTALQQAYDHAAVYGYTPDQCVTIHLYSVKISFVMYRGEAGIHCTKP
ncbi:hypothetical protein BS329_19980 [Amycolatopsis coloradensis]|uniref:DUF732 domain-containing protein n=1 Tax=Amycolatopsis coloradensis TaxID=76021 RepID=A0A1R0KS54_9PSEU|nr:hypothetical protein [Amycolatopsis coloradensis]OLZ50685.1 hypothetical protein BS329_19980 [Amycolatopsis coloradensis]